MSRFLQGESSPYQQGAALFRFQRIFLGHQNAFWELQLSETFAPSNIYKKINKKFETVNCVKIVWGGSHWKPTLRTNLVPPDMTLRLTHQSSRLKPIWLFIRNKNALSQNPKARITLTRPDSRLQGGARRRKPSSRCFRVLTSAVYVLTIGHLRFIHRAHLLYEHAVNYRLLS